MSHYERNIRLVLFLILPVLGFLLGWSINQKSNEQIHNGVGAEVEQMDEGVKIPKQGGLPFKNILFQKIDPSDVDMDLFWETWNVLEGNFLYQERKDTKEQIYGAIKGLVHSLGDPYTVFMTPKETTDFEDSIAGEFEGIGAEIGIQDEKLVIIAPLKGMPADLAGLKAGDVIFKIDGKQSITMSVEEAVMIIRGPKGEKVTLTVVRDGEHKPMDIVIVRDNIVIKSAEYKMYDGVGVLTLTQFGNNVVREFDTAASQMLLENPKGVVVDLRNNGGGLLDACVKILSEFLEEKVAVKTRGRKLGNNGELITTRGGSMTSLPMVVLINKGSASASEIFAGAIQDHKRGVVLGQRSFGKGSVQNVIPLSGGASLKVTIAEWLTPEGRSIHEIGIQPTVVFEVKDEEALKEGEDPVLERALEILADTEEYNRLRQQGPQPEETPEELAGIESEVAPQAEEAKASKK